ncbi:hypothetical protein FRC07_001204 [Ceratobasidium sp. 392]|nr:hypothetical protein FRC07_001204 [Ceratobasidium sp. 392]
MSIPHHTNEASQIVSSPERSSPDATNVPLPISPPLSNSTSSSIHLTDLTSLIETQYKADLAAHAALVPVLLARAESEEGSAQRLAGVVKETRGRMRELELLCVELGEEVGILREEQAGLASERIELDLSAERDEGADIRASKDGEALDAPSEQMSREIKATLRRAEAEAARSRRRKEERNAARAMILELEARISDGRKIRTLEAEKKSSRAEVNSLRRSKSSPRAEEWRVKEAEWERERREWAHQEDTWTRTQAAWAPERARAETRYDEMKTEMVGLRDELATLQTERDTLGAQVADADKMEAELERMDGKMAALVDGARHAEEMYIASQHEVERADARIRELENRSSDGGRVRKLELEKSEMVEAIRASEERFREMERGAIELEERCVKVETERDDVLRDRAEVEEELERLRVEVEDGAHARGEIEQERNALGEELMAEQEAHAALAAEHDNLVQRLQETERGHHIALENQQRLEGVVRTRNQEMAEVEERLFVQSRELDQLRLDKRELEKVKIQRDDAIQAEKHLRSQLEARTSDSSELNTLRDCVAKLSEESARLQKRVNELKAESADKEVRIVQLNKARAVEAEDREGLNVALQAKQQELELIKRKLGVRGTAGATPAPSRVQRSGNIRRESIASSTAFETPMPRAAAMRNGPVDIPGSSETESTASVLSSSVATNPLQTSTRANIYDAMNSTPATVKPVRRTSDYAPRPSIRMSAAQSLSRLSSLSVSGIRGVHFAPSETDTTTETDPDVTVHA